VAADEDVATQLIREYASGSLRRRGPYTIFDSTSEAERVGALIGRVAGHIRYEHDRTWTAPSPWHAAVWLHNLAAGVPNNQYVWPYSRDGELRFDSALLFRGQRKAEWEVSPSLYRLAWAAAHDREGRFSDDRFEEMMWQQFAAVRRFVTALDWITSSDSDIGAQPVAVHIATAQHYGLPTPFLDLSPDPLIATWFACSGAEEQDVAAVYWTPFSGNDLDLPVVLAPPWVRRVHRQKGVFLNYLAGPPADSSRWYRIIFPTSPRYCAAFDEIEPMYPENSWFDAAVAWAVRDTEAPDGGRVLAERLVAEAGWAPFHVDAMMPIEWGKWMDSFVGFCEWLAIRMVDGRFDLTCGPVQKIAKDNPQLLSALTAGQRLPGFRVAMSPDALGGFGARIDECLGL
jgi:FRG domain